MGDIKKDNQLMKKIQCDKRMVELDKNIAFLKKQQDQIGKGGFFNFFVGMFANIVSGVLGALSIIFPAAAPALTIANKFVQGLCQGLMSINPHNKKAGDYGVKAQEASKKAEAENYKVSIADEHLNSAQESRRLIRQRMEEAIRNLQQGASATTKV
ncbi:hypothetical protein K1X76_03770 [bacterium]|nr:hypothetical protein [bacterium]